jgi:hypothetical protein
MTLAVPFGKLAPDLPQSDLLSPGPGIVAEIGFGLSRTVALGAWGQMLRLSGSDDCTRCSATSLAGGLFVRYHLVQGVRFDPWMSAGAGYRMTTLDDGLADQSYSGIDWLRFAVGGDWYAFRYLGFGPFLELDVTSYLSRPDERNDLPFALSFLVGARITLDVPGKR